MTGEPPSTQTLRYPWRALRASYASAALGLLITISVAILAPLGGWAFWIFSIISLIILIYFVQLLAKQLCTYALEPHAFSRQPQTFRKQNTSLPWPPARFIQFTDLSTFKLRYFSGRTGQAGLMQLTLATPHQHLIVDHTLEGFKAIVRQAEAAARTNQVPMDDDTEANLEALESL